MKLLALEIEGYGVWNGLKLQRMSEGINVVYGPNEAGKSTVLHFVRSALYGFSPQRRRYLPPKHGGRPGGWIEVAGAGGQFQIARYASSDGNPRLDELHVAAADGIRQSEQTLKTLLANIDEPTFNHVFAVSLSEMQELATLTDTQAAEMLYSITAGLDRVSLIEVMNELDASRARILDPHGGACQVTQLVHQRDQIARQIEELGSQMHVYSRLLGDRDVIERELAQLDEAKKELQGKFDLHELALNVRDRWHRHRALGEELEGLGPSTGVPANALDRLEALKERSAKHDARMERLRHHRQKLRREAEALDVNEALGRCGPRITATLEQDPWFHSLEGQIAEMEKQHNELHATMFAEYEKMGLGKPERTDRLPTLSSQALTRLRQPGRRLSEAMRRYKGHRRDAEDAHQQAAGVHKQVSQALEDFDAPDFNTATERAGNLVNQLRRRIQVDERLEQLARNQQELHEQSHGLLKDQVPTGTTTIMLVGIFVVGIMLLFAGIFMLPSSWSPAVYWTVSMVGLAIAAAGVLLRYFSQMSNDQQLEQGQNQLRLLESQIKQCQDERAVLDDQLPRGGGPMVARLAAAEKELAALEDLAPLDSRHAAARQDADEAARRADKSDEELRYARREWRDGLEKAGLPADFKPRQVRVAARLAVRIQDMQARMALLDDELAQRRRERDMLHSRVSQLVADCGADVKAGHPLDKVRELSEMLTRQEARVARRDVIRKRLRKLRRLRTKGESAVAAAAQRRRRLLRQHGAKSEEHLQKLVGETVRVENLRREHEQLGHDLEAAIGSRWSPGFSRHVSEQPAEAGTPARAAIESLLEGPTAETLPAVRDDLRARLTAIEKDIHQRIETRGRIAAQLTAITEDRQMAARQLEMATVQQRIDEAIGRWQVLAVTGNVLESIRSSYETDRQPETLREASGYFQEMTQGKYRRVWTPVGERVLRVEDSEGQDLAVEVLSRGAREQLFLSLRLALAAHFARRGAALPLILDDVLVNFDMDRARAAAQVLRDFAGLGHQMLVFTCHDHIAKLFKGLKVPVCELPSNAEHNPPPLVFDDGVKEKLRKPAARKPGKSRLTEPEEMPLETPEPVAVISEPPWESPEPTFAAAMEPVGEVWEEE
jgi:uncharacterized protein YhaN